MISGSDNESIETEDLGTKKGRVNSLMKRLKLRIRRVFKETIEPRGVGKLPDIETTHMREERMRVEKIEKPGNSFYLLKMFNDKSFKQSMLGITQASAWLFFVRKAGKIEAFE